MKVILISGKISSGKNYVTDKLTEYLNSIFNSIGQIVKEQVYNPTPLFFAEPVKQIAKDLFDWDGEKDEKGRKLLINIGTYLGKGLSYNLNTTKSKHGYNGEDITELYKKFTKYFTPNINLWASILKDKMMYLNAVNLLSDNIFIISDYRFKNESYYLKSIFDNDVITLRVKENHRTQYIEDISETDLDNVDFDYYIDNSKDNDDNYLIEQFKNIKL